jgi:hypothetical protein
LQQQIIFEPSRDGEIGPELLNEYLTHLQSWEEWGQPNGFSYMLGPGGKTPEHLSETNWWKSFYQPELLDLFPAAT